MKLHHTTDRPDWAAVTPQKRNHWQRLAADTRGVVTPANCVSLLGLLLVVAGLAAMVYHHLAFGFWLILSGRTCDILDGVIADRTGTKSPLGEAVDASFDKTGAIVLLIFFWRQGIAPWWVIALVAVQNIANAVIGIVIRRYKLSVHPHAMGKVATAGQWLVFCCFILAAMEGRAWLVPAYAALLPTLGLGFVAMAYYCKPLVAFWAANESPSSSRRT